MVNFRLLYCMPLSVKGTEQWPASSPSPLSSARIEEHVDGIVGSIGPS